MAESEPAATRHYGVLELLLAAFMCVLTLVVLGQVALRYLTNQPFAWTEEAARMLFIWSCMLGAALASKRSMQFSVEFISQSVTGTQGRVLRATLKLIEAALYGLLVWAGAVVTAVAHDQQLAILRVPMSVGYVALPIAATLMAAFTLRQAWSELRG